MISSVNVPTILTLIRLILSPLFLPITLVYLLPYNFIWLNISLASMFVLLSLTDFLDGYLARKLNQVTTFGRILDPLADKFLVASTLIALTVINKIYFFWVVILIGREFFVLGLRQGALENNFNISVSFLGKVKTTIQMLCLTLIIANPYQSLGLADAFWWNMGEMGLVFLMLAFSLYSAQKYFEQFLVHYFAESRIKLEDHVSKDAENE